MTFNQMNQLIGQLIAAYEEETGGLVSCRIYDQDHPEYQGQVYWWNGSGFIQGRLDRLTNEEYSNLSKQTRNSHAG